MGGSKNKKEVISNQSNIPIRAETVSQPSISKPRLRFEEQSIRQTNGISTDLSVEQLKAKRQETTNRIKNLEQRIENAWGNDSVVERLETVKARSEDAIKLIDYDLKMKGG
ncbi:MAG: hypothetical protein IJS60_08820 [Abditibacteriota bacterium]|nr:hypothetical protein [Abditibacteriota bacterium]